MFKQKSVPLSLFASLCIATLLTGTSRAAIRTWTNGAGAGNVNWQKNTNWSGTTPPANGDRLVFSGTLGLSNTDNISGLSVNGIAFAAPAGAFTLNGSPITVSGTIVNNSTNTQTLSFNGTGITLGGMLQVIATSGQIDFETKVNLNGSSLQVGGSNTVVFDQKISGTGANPFGALIIGDPTGATANVVLNANNNTLGDNGGGIGVALYGGTLTVNNGGALGTGTFRIDQSGTGPVTFGSGSDSVNVSANVDVNTSFNIQASTSGTTGMVLSGTVTLDSSGNPITITALNGNTVRFANTIQQNNGAPALTLDGGGVNGTFVFGGSNANTYTGLTTVTNGAALSLNKTDNTTAIAGDLQIDAGSSVRLQSVEQIADTSNVTANGIFDINGNNETINGLLGSGTTRLGSGTLTVSSGSFSGDIRDNGNVGSLVKTGTGTLTLDSANHYSGGTTLKSGTLIVNNANALGSGTLVINGASSTLGSLASGIQLVNDVDVLTSFNVAPSGTVGSGTLTMKGLVTLDTGTASGTTNFTITQTNANVFRFIGGIAQGGSGVASLTYDGGGSGVQGSFRIGNSTAASTYGGLTTVTDYATLILNNSGTSLAVPGNLQIDANSTVRYVANSEEIADTATVTDNGTWNLNNRNETIATLLGSGTVQVGSGSFTVSGGTFSGALNGSGASLTKTGTGTLLLTGANFLTGSTNINGGQLILDGSIGTTVFANTGIFSGTGFVADTLVNASQVTPGHTGLPGTLLVKGYTQTSAGTLTLRVGGTGAGQSDQLHDEGSAALDGTLQLVRLNNFQGKLGDKIALVLADSGRTGTFASIINPFGTNTMVTAEVVYDANNVYLSFDQASFARFAASQRLTPNESSVAAALDGVATDPRAAALIAFLDGEPLGNLAGDFDLISPDELAAIFDISKSFADVQGANIENRLAQDRAETTPGGVTVGLMVGDGKSSVDKNVTETAPERASRWDVFMEGSGDFVHVNGDLNAPGYDFTTSGVTLGADYRVNNHLVLGIMGGYANTGSTLVNNGSVDVNSGKLGLFATAYGHGLYLNMMAAGGYNSYDTHRLGLGGVAQGSTEGEEFDGLISTGYDIHQDHFTLGPIVTAQYTYVGIDSYTEFGSLAPLTIVSQNQQSLRSKAGFHISYEGKVGGVTITPGVTAGWQHEFLDSTSAIDSRFASGAGNVFRVNGPAIGRDSVVVNAGVSIQWNSRLGTYLYYDGELGRKNYQLNSVTGGVKVSF